ncbi:MAG: pantoate--beta-alanine ligase [Candidatus Kapaibacterium sp.]
MRIIETVQEMQALSDAHRARGKRIIVVPTMGYLHEGHMSLMRRAAEMGDIVITTLFVNPTQFGPNEDFERYPRNFERDVQLAEESGCDYLFYPSVQEMYPEGYSSYVMLHGITDKFEGAIRPKHFNGVATVCAKLFNITKPHAAIFGQKDYQQTLVVKRFVRDLDFDVEIIVLPTVRESDGLAMSSRNTYLSDEDRSKAGILFAALEKARKAIVTGERRRKTINGIMHNVLRSEPTMKIDYASAADSETLDEPEVFIDGQRIVMMIACYLGRTRLIDNMLINIPEDPSVRKYNFEE